MKQNIAIRVEHLSKIYKIFPNPIDRVKETFHPFRKRYSRDFFALNDLSFEVRKGETVGIIGKNGAGKSTLLKIITGVLTPSSGTIQTSGRIASLLELGAGFNPEMTGLENIYLSGTIMGCSKETMDARLDEILAFADIGDFIHQPVKTYSSGMFARLAFAVNSNVEPDILIVDEALAVGDIFFQNKCFRKLEDLREKGTTVLFVSHDMGSVKQLCTHVIWLEHGRTRMEGESENICSLYFNEEIEKRNEATLIKSTANGEQLKVEGNISRKKTFHRLNYKTEDLLSEKAQILSFFILDSNQQETNIMEANQTYEIHILLHAHADLPQCILGITFTNPKGIDIIGTNTYSVSKGKNFSMQADSHMEVVFSFVLPDLLPGTYLWDTALALGTQESHIILTWLHGVSAVEVVNKDSNRLGLVGISCDNSFFHLEPSNFDLL